MADGKGVLERLFDSSTAKVLDHLMLARGMQFSLEELSNIHDVQWSTMNRILHYLRTEFDLVDSSIENGVRKYTLAGNERTDALLRFVRSVSLRNMERVDIT